MPDPTIAAFASYVRLAGPKGATAERVAALSGTSLQATKAALELQVQAGEMSSEEAWNGERYVGTVYRMREGV